jgi:hypothetical protein
MQNAKVVRLVVGVMKEGLHWKADELTVAELISGCGTVSWG